ncbi:MAG: membrane integrity-associated transporter subunit PqiC [Parvularculaceae bacterium]|nr:membrane integrity-associated transporter subunit PqiC [Parvularculaceae bacterium]
MQKLLFMIAALALSACVNVLPKAPPASPRFLISAVDAAEAPASSVDWSLVVEDPQASRVFDHTKIALAREPGRVEFYADGEWADRAPRLFQSSLVRSFENTGRILGVGDRIAQPVGDYALQTDIRRMEADIRGGQAHAVFSVYVRLVNSRGKVVAGRLFQAEEEAQENSGPAVARALDIAAGAVIADILAWTFENGAAARTKTP